MNKEPVTGRGERTRDVLLDAAREEFWENGFLATRVAGIAQRAAVSYGTFYTYFDSKDAVLWALAADLHDKVVEHNAGARAEAGGDDARAIEVANRRYLEFYREHRKTMRLMEEVAAFDPDMRAARRRTLMQFAERAARSIRRMQSDGRCDPGLDVDVAALALASMVAQYAYVTVAMGAELDPGKAAPTLSAIWARGIGLDVPWGLE